MHFSPSWINNNLLSYSLIIQFQLVSIYRVINQTSSPSFSHLIMNLGLIYLEYLSTNNNNNARLNLHIHILYFCKTTFKDHYP